MAVLPVAGEDVLKVNTAHWTALSSPSTLYLEEQTGWRVDCPLYVSQVYKPSHSDKKYLQLISVSLAFSRRIFQFSTFLLLSLSQTNKDTSCNWI